MKKKYFNKKLFAEKIFNLCHKQPLRLFYFCFLPKKIRNPISKLVYNKKIHLLKNCAEKFIYDYELGILNKYQLYPKKFPSKKIIWQYWGEGIDYNKLP